MLKKDKWRKAESFRVKYADAIMENFRILILLYLQRGFVQLFNISRINTDFGIFRVSGDWCFKKPEVESISLKSIEVMGTDGWVLLNKTSESNSQLINNLLPLLLSHLLLKNNAV
ncbi:hypothetical protein Glaag_2818 [Glaciecola sp. 4H-3-7+YE-5]|nr:hypothetical protein Glaag_2818 [Glaciecola sp. 4H-3-7+YE-5]